MSASSSQLIRAGQWLLHSGIQCPNAGVARFYRSDLKQNQAISTEITGYQASGLAWLYTVTGDQQYLDRASQTADFLVTKAWDPSLRTFPFEYPERTAAYFFDIGMILRGLLAVWRITGAPQLLETAEACAGQMLRDFDAGFDFHPILDLPSKASALRDPHWSHSSGCYQLKVALAWKELGHITGNKALHSAWERVCAQSIDSHEQFLPGHSDEQRVMDRLHAYCYFLEALTAAPENAAARAALAVGIQRVAFLLHRIAPVFVRCDVYAQLLRARLFASGSGILPLDSHTAAFEAGLLATFEVHSPDPRLDGGFLFGRKGAESLPYVNPVSTWFATQALHLWHHRDPVLSGLV